MTEAGIRFPDKARVEDILNAMVVHCLARIGSIRGQFTSASGAGENRGIRLVLHRVACGRSDNTE